MDNLQKLYEEFNYENIYIFDPNKIGFQKPCKYCGKNFEEGDIAIEKPFDFRNFYHVDCYRDLEK